jgi:hypothetical protein
MSFRDSAVWRTVHSVFGKIRFLRNVSMKKFLAWDCIRIFVTRHCGVKYRKLALLTGNFSRPLFLGKGAYISGHGALHFALQGLQYAIISISQVEIT